MIGLAATFQVRVRMLSDWIVGTGEGRVGDVDATVRRDGDGLPFVPAKTLTGVWRDACEQVAVWLGGAGTAAADNPWLDWVDWVFGSQPDRDGDRTAHKRQAPRPAALSLSPARLPSGLRASCRTRPALRAAAVILRPGVAIDHRTGTARDDMLRLEERARPGLLTAGAEFGLDGGGLPAAAELLLRAGAAAVDSLGGKRNRGAGRCWILLPGMPASPDGQAPLPAAQRPADERLAELAGDTRLLDNPGPPPADRARPAARLSIPPSSGRAPEASPGAPVTWRVTMEVVTPVIAQQRVLGNVVMSLESVPGSVLLPEILARIDGPVGHRDLVVGDARPAVSGLEETVPARPAPMAWYRPKDRHHRDTVNAMVARLDPAERPKAMRSGHVAPAAPGAWHLVTPEMAVSTHAVIDDDEGRPTEARGGVFTYLGLAPGTLLASDIVLPASARLRLAAGDRLRLGRSRKDDFGAVQVRDVQQVTAPPVPDVAAGSRVRVWCVSDVLLRDPWGAPDPTPRALAAELTRRLEVPVTAVAQEPDGRNIQAACRSARRESFHARWGRPRPSLTGLAAGSVVTVEMTADLPGARLAAVQRDGIGERTAEGFGQVRFDPPELAVAVPQLIPLPAGRPQEAAASDGEELPPGPDPLELAAVTAEISRQVAILIAGGAGDVAPGVAKDLSRAQWGSLREQAGRLRTPGGLDAVHRWFDQSREVRQRRALWGRAALDRLEQILTDEHEIWTVLGLDGPALDPFVLAPPRAAKVREELRLTAVTALIDELTRDATLTSQAGGEPR